MTFNPLGVAHHSDGAGRHVNATIVRREQMRAAATTPSTTVDACRAPSSPHRPSELSRRVEWFFFDPISLARRRV